MRNRGITLLELLMVMASLAVVSSMGFHLLHTTADSLNRGVNVNSRGNQFRVLFQRLDEDMAARFPTPSEAPLEIGTAEVDSATAPFLRTRILEQTEDGRVRLVELTYSLERYGGDEGETSLVRIVDPDPAPGRGPEAEVRPILTLSRTQRLAWEAAPETSGFGNSWIRLDLTFEDDLFPGWPVVREVRLVARTGESST